jgi:Oxidoreductase molybdopterin binding domain
MSPISRGFRHLHRASDEDAGRVPPGQYVTKGFPVLSAGPTPRTPLEKWTFSITQGGQIRKSWTWQEFRALPTETIAADIHCVTRWSKLGTEWRGVSVDTLLGQAGYDAPYVMASCDGGYTTNLPIADVTGGQAWVPSATTAARWRLSTAVRPGCWCRTCISGRAPSGCAAWTCATPMSRGSGRATAITCMGTHGENSGTRATDRAGNGSACHTNSPCRWASRTKSPCDGGVDRTFLTAERPFLETIWSRPYTGSRSGDA